jgi:hypothetical protein
MFGLSIRRRRRSRSFFETIRTVATATLTTITSLSQKMLCEDVEAILDVKIFSFFEFHSCPDNYRGVVGS